MEVEFPILHVLVVGFHHKKGCQIEFAYPSFDVDIEKTAWKHLPTLAMPDGAHNFKTDTVYFHLPSLKKPGETVFGVACFEQIDAQKVKNKSDDVTRSTIQKSVCVLSKYPLYGHIQVKMQLITAAYFREGDFGQISILEEAYHNLNACLTTDLLTTPETFVGLSPRDLIFTFRHDVLVLLKCLLLEKRILFRGPSVGPLCSSLLTLVSLLPLQVEYGLGESACVKSTITNRTMSIVPQFSRDMEYEDIEDTTDEEKRDDEKPCPNSLIEKETCRIGDGLDDSERKEKRTKDLINSSLIQGSVSPRSRSSSIAGLANNTLSSVGAVASEPIPMYCDSTDDNARIICSPPNNNDKHHNDLLKTSGSVGSFIGSESIASISGSEKNNTEDIPDFLNAVQLSGEDAGLPLKIFTKGYLCHPYLSLHYLDLLSDQGVRGFIVGATNILFKQKRDIVDVIVEMSSSSIEILDPSLRKLVSLSTEDLRFAEFLVKNVTHEGNHQSSQNQSAVGSAKFTEDSFLDGVGWEGGDEWIRAQFKYYLMCALRTSQVDAGQSSEHLLRLRDCFGFGFLTSWQNTSSWIEWNDYINSEERTTPGIYLLAPGHPSYNSSGQLSVNDVKLRLAHSIQKTESGRKFNQAVGKAVSNTGKVMGGAITTAKGALSSWWTTVTAATSTSSGGAQGVEIGSENVDDSEDARNANNAAEPTVPEPKRHTVWFTT